MSVTLSPQAQQFTQQISQLAAKYGVKLVTAFSDPVSGTPCIIQTPGALDTLKPFIAEKLGLADERALREKLSAEFEGATGWDT